MTKPNLPVPTTPPAKKSSLARIRAATPAGWDVELKDAAPFSAASGGNVKSAMGRRMCQPRQRQKWLSINLTEFFLVSKSTIKRQSEKC